MSEDVTERVAKMEGALEQVSKTAHEAMRIGVETKVNLAKHEESKENLYKQVVRHSEKSDSNYNKLNDKIDDKFGIVSEELKDLRSTIDKWIGLASLGRYVVGIIVGIIAGFIGRSMGVW